LSINPATAWPLPTPDVLEFEKPACEKATPTKAIGMDKKQQKKKNSGAMTVNIRETIPNTIPAAAALLDGRR
jgi:hypothetical protein|tara:strand:- start:112 stop:327 length:216 start_codon:yes stop_codon:yes gene_type:complete